MNLESKIEALLFFKGEPLTLKYMMGIFDVDFEKLSLAIADLEKSLVNRGVSIVYTDDKVALGTNIEMSDFFEKIQKEEINKDLSKASLETLSIILYKDNVSKSEINLIRGVNSSFILRNLEARGLIEKNHNKSNLKGYVYKPSIELLSYMGVTSVDELPEYNNLQETLKNKLLNQNYKDENN